jgi:hypothetical protein
MAGVSTAGSGVSFEDSLSGAREVAVGGGSRTASEAAAVSAIAGSAGAAEPNVSAAPAVAGVGTAGSS